MDGDNGREVDGGARSVWADGRLGRGGPERGPRVVFGQVREDADVEVEHLRRLPRARRIVAIASGGCTALALAAAAPPGAEVVAVDVNPAQVFLCELKLASIRRLERLELQTAVVRDARPALARLEPELSRGAREFWKARSGLLEHGLNQCGAIDRRLQFARRLLFATTVPRRRVEAFLSQEDPSAQERCFRESWDGWRWRTAFRLLLIRPLLRAVYGRAVLDALPSGFADPLRARIERSLVATPARLNPYAWQTFLGRYSSDEDGCLPYWLRRNAVAVLRSASVPIRLVVADVAEWLQGQPPCSCDFLALSNVLEAAPPTFVSKLFGALRHAAAPGASVVMRRIVPTPIDARSHAGFELDAEASEKLSALDRSGVCADVRVYRRAC